MAAQPVALDIVPARPYYDFTCTVPKRDLVFGCRVNDAQIDAALGRPDVVADHPQPIKRDRYGSERVLLARLAHPAWASARGERAPRFAALVERAADAAVPVRLAGHDQCVFTTLPAAPGQVLPVRRSAGTYEVSVVDTVATYRGYTVARVDGLPDRSAR